jgi:hypothetical protein
LKIINGNVLGIGSCRTALTVKMSSRSLLSPRCSAQIPHGIHGIRTDSVRIRMEWGNTMKHNFNCVLAQSSPCGFRTDSTRIASFWHGSSDFARTFPSNLFSARIRTDFRPSTVLFGPLGQLGQVWHTYHALQNFTPYEDRTNNLVCSSIAWHSRPLHHQGIVG